ncbi:hypothetical protein J4E80_006633 [Alternaria sp. BMP 0032]|nr:hypothetical protein J4E80_006633 [Alternaria sp. BMP 0032]
MELPASELELVVEELELTEELVMVLELNNVEEVDVKLKLSVDDEFVMGNSVAKPAEVLELSILVNGGLEELNDDVGLDVLLKADGGAELDIISNVELELALVDTRDGDVTRPVDATTEELPTLVGRVAGGKLLGEKEVDVDSD